MKKTFTNLPFVDFSMPDQYAKPTGEELYRFFYQNFMINDLNPKSTIRGLKVFVLQTKTWNIQGANPYVARPRQH